MKIFPFQLAQGDWKGAISQAGQQQLKNLIANHPELANLPIDKLFPMVDGVIAGDWESVARQAGEFARQKGLDLASKELLKAYPQLAQTPLGALPIDNLTVGDITGLADKPLATISKIGNRYLSELGNFSQTPGTMLAVDSAMILLTGDVFGRLDISYAGPTETPVTHVLTGGTRNQVFLPEPCTETSCKHFEISDVLSGFGGLGNVQGKAWVEGKSQSVPGGKGFLQVVNGGKERTGVPVWSTDAHVKLSLEDIDEGGNGKPATAQVWMNFQVCVYPPFLGEHCT
ncbi:MAG: peptidoglycan DD-metalloendopeptidase family protein, partial [Microcystaceae cyanobacterium]